MVEHNSALGNVDDEILAPRPVLVGSTAMGAVGSLPVRVVSESKQGGDIAVGHQPDRASVAAVTAGRAAPGDVGLAPKRNAARAPVSGLDIDVALVDESGHRTEVTASPSGRVSLFEQANRVADDLHRPGGALIEHSICTELVVHRPPAGRPA